MNTTERAKRGTKLTDSFCAETVQSCYRKAIAKSKRLTVPELCLCEMVCGNIKDYIPRIGTRSSSFPVPLGRAQKHARLFLQHLPAAKTTVTEWGRRNGDLDRDNPQFERLVTIEVARETVTKLLDQLARPNPKPYSESDFAGWIAAWGMEGWHQAGCVPPKSVNPDDPLCIFVTEILRATGLLGRREVRQDTVSEWLRRRRRRKDG